MSTVVAIVVVIFLLGMACGLWVSWHILSFRFRAQQFRFHIEQDDVVGSGHEPGGRGSYATDHDPPSKSSEVREVN